MASPEDCGFVKPCKLAKELGCPGFPAAKCMNDYCGGCFARWTMGEGPDKHKVECDHGEGEPKDEPEPPVDCIPRPQLSGLDLLASLRPGASNRPLSTGISGVPFCESPPPAPLPPPPPALPPRATIFLDRTDPSTGGPHPSVGSGHAWKLLGEGFSQLTDTAVCEFAVDRNLTLSSDPRGDPAPYEKPACPVVTTPLSIGSDTALSCEWEGAELCPEVAYRLRILTDAAQPGSAVASLTGSEPRYTIYDPNIVKLSAASPSALQMPSPADAVTSTFVEVTGAGFRDLGEGQLVCKFKNLGEDQSGNSVSVLRAARYIDGSRLECELTHAELKAAARDPSIPISLLVSLNKGVAMIAIALVCRFCYLQANQRQRRWAVRRKALAEEEARAKAGGSPRAVSLHGDGRVAEAEAGLPAGTLAAAPQPGRCARCCTAVKSVCPALYLAWAFNMALQLGCLWWFNAYGAFFGHEATVEMLIEWGASMSLSWFGLEPVKIALLVALVVWWRRRKARKAAEKEAAKKLAKEQGLKGGEEEGTQLV